MTNLPASAKTYPTDLGDHNAARSRLHPAIRTYYGILLGALCLGTWDLLFARIYWNAEGWQSEPQRRCEDSNRGSRVSLFHCSLHGARLLSA